MSIATDVAAAVASAQSDRFIDRADFPAGPAGDKALTRAIASRDDILRIRRGLYWKGTKTRFGITKPRAVDVALKVAGEGAGPAEWSALAAIGATTQVPAQPTVAALHQRTSIPGKVIKRSNPRRIDLRPIEVAVLEALRPGWAERADTDIGPLVRHLADRRAIRPAHLIRTAAGEPKRVRQRLEAALTA